MKVKQYRAVTLQEAFAQAQAEMGEDAVLLHQKDVLQPAQLGQRARTLVEITVGVDQSQNPTTKGVEREAIVRRFAPPTAPTSARPTPFFAAPAAPPTRGQDEFDSLRREIAQIRSLLQRRNRQSANLLPALSDWSNALAECALPDSWIDRLLDGLDEMLTPTALRRSDMVSGALTRRMAAEMASPLGALQPGKPGNPLVFLLVGPTGVGKTTTIAKLAAHFALQKRLPIAIITADTFRIGAVSQLRTYSELMQAPLEVAYTPDELSQQIAKHQDKALILVDTPGRSPADGEQLAILESFVAGVEKPHLQIALAAGTPLADARRIIQRFSIVPPQGVVLTKVDETDYFGPICALLAECQLPLSYMTTGQRVPEDIQIASNEELLARMLLQARHHLPESEAVSQTAIYPVSAHFQRFADLAQAR
ncbi:MAG: flagellar biosynthesis protein FlhF [Caldilineaceae bacterium]|nr:flagellar biosynthesis protein FlhF [Caldilineaceae bacterium]